MATIEVAYNTREYVTFQIKDATPEEVEILRDAEQGDYQSKAFTLLTEMAEAGRLFDDEVAPEIFSEHVDPNIISVEGED
jgi:hypothetical protein